MKKSIIIFILSILNFTGFTILGQNNCGAIVYSVQNNEAQKNHNSDISDFMEKTNAELIKLKFTLEFNSKESIFKLSEELEIDDTSYFRNMALAVAGASNKIWYTNSDKIINQYNFMNELFLIESHKKSIAWELTNESKRIGKYLCYKATCVLKNVGSKGIGEKKVTVWYTPEIPIQLGPLGLVGLPGLILEVQFFNVTYFASEIKLNVENNIEIKKPTKGKVISENDFLDIATTKVKQFREDIQKN